MENSRRHLAAYVGKLHRKACCTWIGIIFPHSTDKSSTRERERKRKRFFFSHHACLALWKTMSASITPVVQAIERKETRNKTRFFSATTATLSFICMTIMNNTALQKRQKHDNYCHLIIRVQYIITFIQHSNKVKSICLSFQSTMR